MFEMFKEFIKPELLVLIPVLYIMGMGLKTSEISDKHIPLILGGISIFLCIMYTAATSDFYSGREAFMVLFTSFTQGILCAGASVYFNQIVKQLNKDE